tara:strand:- start:687 stop:791 length:105 start_codon:yes stop_codon:yes gene_type:complete
MSSLLVVELVQDQVAAVVQDNTSQDQQLLPLVEV